MKYIQCFTADTNNMQSHVHVSRVKEENRINTGIIIKKRLKSVAKK